ncbi:MAG: hypothetical protein AAFN10_27555, partial [Bacteroidota bacterium]
CLAPYQGIDIFFGLNLSQLQNIPSDGYGLYVEGSTPNNATTVSTAPSKNWSSALTMGIGFGF